MAQFKLRMPPALREAIEESAVRDEASLNTEIVTRLTRTVQQDQVLGSREMSRLAFHMAAAFAFATQGKDWPNDPVAYAQGTAAVIDALIREMPGGEDRPRAVEAVISRLLSLLAQSREEAR